MGLTSEELQQMYQDTKVGDISLADVAITVDVDVITNSDIESFERRTISRAILRMRSPVHGIALKMACRKRGTDPCTYIQEAVESRMMADGFDISGIDGEVSNAPKMFWWSMDRLAREYIEHYNKCKEIEGRTSLIGRIWLAFLRLIRTVREA